METEALAKILEMRNLARKIEEIQTDMVLSPYWKELTEVPGSPALGTMGTPYGMLKLAVLGIAVLVKEELREAALEGVKA